MRIDPIVHPTQKELLRLAAFRKARGQTYGKIVFLPKFKIAPRIAAERNEADPVRPVDFRRKTQAKTLPRAVVRTGPTPQGCICHIRYAANQRTNTFRGGLWQI